MFNIALTGGIASGKSTVVELFKKHQVPIIDADDIAHSLVLPHTEAYQKIVSHFGEGVKIQEGSEGLDREKLRDIIFKNPAQRIWLEELLHPLILKEMFEQAGCIQAPYCLLIIPLLTEIGLHHNKFFIHRILLVDCEEKLQIERLKARDKISEPLIKKILHTQNTRSERLEIANDVIENNKDLKRLEKIVLNLHEKYIKLAQSSK